MAPPNSAFDLENPVELDGFAKRTVGLIVLRIPFLEWRVVGRRISMGILGRDIVDAMVRLFDATCA